MALVKSATVYLDHAATSPLMPQARAAMQAGFDIWANPSSPHGAGRAARAALEDARARIKAVLGWDGELVFTSGASEAISLAMTRTKQSRAIISAVEHDAVVRAAPGADFVPIFGGTVDTGALAKFLEEKTALVAVQHVNPETGTIVMTGASNPLADQVRTAGGVLMVDASQSAGKLALPDADMIVVSAHKLGGPIGVGALLLRDFAMLEPVGGHEYGYRMGTENLPAILGFAAALEAGGIKGWNTSAAERSGFRDALRAFGQVVEPGAQCSHIIALAVAGLPANAALIRLDAMGIAVSAGSACSSGTLKRSRALAGFGIADDIAARTIRISLGWSTTKADLNACLTALATMTGRAAA